MFWGLIMEPNKRYTQTVEKSFHLSMASLDISQNSSDEVVQVMLCFENSNYLLCNLKKGSVWQVPLDLNFQQGTKIAFVCNGKSYVHLTGYLIEDDLDMDDMEAEEDEEEEEEENQSQEDIKHSKRKLTNKAKENKSVKRPKVDLQTMDEDDSDEDDEDYVAEDNTLTDSDEDSGEEEEEEESGDEDEDEEESEDDDEEEVKNSIIEQQKKKKKQNQQQQQQDQRKKKIKGDEKVLNGKESPKNKKQKKQKGKQQENSFENHTNAQDKKTVNVTDSGLKIEDLKVGHGAIVKGGSTVSCHYIGRLKNGKKFDMNNRGDGYVFRVGAGDVIKGWELGIRGMKVGGKRRLTIPAHLAYGTKGSPPLIPPNATLIFDIDLKKVH